MPTSNTIATKLQLPLQLTPFHVGIVTEALIEEQYDVTVSSALTNISNVNIQPGNGVNDFFIIRGFDSLSSGLILTDGAPEPEATFWQLYNVELVEVLKEELRLRGVTTPFTITTPYINTIPVSQQPPYPGSRELERRIKELRARLDRRDQDPVPR